MEHKEIKKLHKLLTEEGIPHDFAPHDAGGYRISYFGNKDIPEAKYDIYHSHILEAICSAIETPKSLGNEEDKIEISGLLSSEERDHDFILGYLTAENVFERIKTHWEQ